MKRMIYFALAAALLLCGCTGKTAQDAGGSTSETSQPVTAELFKLRRDNEKDALDINAYEDIAGLFSAVTQLDSIEICCPSMGDNIGSITIALYQWQGSYDSTVAQPPMYTQVFEDFKDNEWLRLDTAGCAPGDYLYRVSGGSQRVGVWRTRRPDGYVTTFRYGVISDGGDCMARVNYRQTPDELYQAPPIAGELSGQVTTPEEIVYPADHPIYSYDARPDNYSAVDGLGRLLPGFADIGARDDGKTRQVGLFYWTWHYNFTGCKPLNITEHIKQHPDAVNDYAHASWPTDAAYQNFWNKPLLGYYSSCDEWVLRKHAEMLADAGVDVIIFDCTNGTYTWRPSYMALLETFAQARADGVNTPQIAFLLPFGASADAAVSLRQLYLDVYRAGKYQDLWYYWKGKPLMMAYPNALQGNDDKISKEIRDFFTFRPGQPVYADGNTGGDRWGWLSVYPQQVYKNTDGTPEQMAVGIAQNWSAEKGLTAMNGQNVFGRTYTSKGYDTRPDAMLYGANFAEQFEYALEVDPEFIFITGWNEWVAGRYDEWGGVSNAFPDEYDDLNSRDAEPSAGPLKDYYYYQMASYIRQYKGVRPSATASAAKTIDISTDTDQWSDVLPVYYAYQNNTAPRDFGGYSGWHYNNDTGRNDIVETRVARDDDYVYFMVRTQDELSPYTDRAWMRLFISVGGLDIANGWEGYQFAINRTGPTADRAVLEASTGGWNWRTVGEVAYRVKGDRMEIALPKAMLGITGGSFKLHFKWSDNMQHDGDILDFYQYGDTAPMGRWNYCYTAE